jgi:hypothetical protein
MLIANMGVPIVCVAVPVMLIALLPIAGIEWRRIFRPEGPILSAQAEGLGP